MTWLNKLSFMNDDLKDIIHEWWKISFMNDMAQQVIIYKWWSHQWYLVKPREGGWKVVSLVMKDLIHEWHGSKRHQSSEYTFPTNKYIHDKYFNNKYMNGCQVWMSHVKNMSHIIRRMPYLYRSFSAKEPYNLWLLHTQMVVRSEWVTSNVWVMSSYEKSCHSYEWVAWMSHGNHAPANGCQMSMSHVKCMSHTNIWIRHATRMNESRYPRSRE